MRRPTPQKSAALARKLLAWYGANARVLPWRAALPHRADDADGWLVQYDLRDLTAWRENKRNHWWSAARKAQNRLDALQSGSLDHDWTEAKHAMEKLARQHDQLLIMSWTPAHFAASSATPEVSRPATRSCTEQTAKALSA